ncbi:MAG TPA: hypothetical protein EYQ58_06710 [Candidatus Poseidoniales archaeon]|nr:hypothetical protein [Candidatus Poseidoniales archaeon]
MLTERENVEKKYLFIILIIYLFWHVCGRIGLSIDLQWHIDVGRDQMFTPPHVMILAGLFPAMIVSLLFLIWTTRDYHRGIEVPGLKIGPIVAPVAIWMTLLGQVTIILGGLFDDYWHAQYGIDVNITTPPHLWTISGGVVAEIATLVLACQLISMSQREENSENKLLIMIALLAIWTLLIHSFFTVGNFLDPREAVVELAGLKLLPHLALAGFVTIIIIEITNHLFGLEGTTKLSMISLTLQLLLLFSIPMIVEMLMGPEHVYRPGSPHQVLVPSLLPWLLLPAIICFRKWPILMNNKWAYLAIVLCTNPIWLPLGSEYIPSLVDGIGLTISILISIPVMHFAISSSKKVITIIDNLMLRVIYKKETKVKKDAKIKSALGTSIAILLIICMMFIPVTQGHGGVHRTEKGDGFDAPMRMLFDIEETDFWVEFMIYPPKALGATEIFIFPVDETTNVSKLWMEIVFMDEKGETRMVSQFEKLSGREMWVSTVEFPFSGNNTIEFWATIDGNSEFTAIDVYVESPAFLSARMAWTIGLGWPIAMGLIFWKLSIHMAAKAESEQE